MLRAGSSCPKKYNIGRVEVFYIINIADDSGEAFLESIKWFADVVLKTIMDIPV